MAKQIRRVSDLPEWFDLAKYDDSLSLDSAGWYEQLAVRRHMARLIDSERWENFQDDGSSKLRELYIREFALIRANPLIDVNSDFGLKVSFLGGALHELKTRNPRYSFGVHLATVRNLYLTERDIEVEKRDYARNFFAQFENRDWLNDDPFEFPCTDWIDEPVDGVRKTSIPQVNVSVNLSLPDKVLIKQFIQMLQSLRDPLQRVYYPDPDQRKPDYSNWVRFGVLPYLDLRIWEREAEIKIPNRVMADAIFPPGVGGEEVVRKTTAKLAEELQTLESLETLAALAAHEIAERNRE